MATYTEAVRIQIIVERQTEHGLFRDAVYMSKDEFESLDDKAVEELTNTRVSNWVATVETLKAQPPVEHTKEELTSQSERLQAEIDRLKLAIAAKETVKG